MAAWLLAEAGLDVTTSCWALRRSSRRRRPSRGANSPSYARQGLRGNQRAGTGFASRCAHGGPHRGCRAGTGFKPPMKGMALVAIEWLRKSHAPVLAVDLPSGWPADETGAMASGAVFPADAVITFTRPSQRTFSGASPAAGISPLLSRPSARPRPQSSPGSASTGQARRWLWRKRPAPPRPTRAISATCSWWAAHLVQPEARRERRR